MCCDLDSVRQGAVSRQNPQRRVYPMHYTRRIEISKKVLLKQNLAPKIQSMLRGFWATPF
jgi:hypothetical protein